MNYLNCPVIEYLRDKISTVSTGITCKIDSKVSVKIRNGTKMLKTGPVKGVV